MKIFLVGMTGSGKSTLGKQLALRMNYSFLDSDQWIEEKEGKTIPEIFQQNGEPYFRKLESDFIEHAKFLKNTIIATGAGLPCFNNQMENMNELGKTIWLDVEDNILVERLSNDSTPRPKLLEFSSINEAIRSMKLSRKEFYEKAQLRIENPTAESLLQILNS